LASARAQSRGNGAVQRIDPRAGVVPDALRGWVKTGRVEAGVSPGTTTFGGLRLEALEHEVKELRRANEILLGRPFRESWHGQVSIRYVRFSADGNLLAPGLP
jgi:transposase-like protein